MIITAVKSTNVKILQEKLEDDYHKKIEENKRIAEEKTAKKRAKRLKKKLKAKSKEKKPKMDNNSKHSSQSDSDNDDSDKDETEKVED